MRATFPWRWTSGRPALPLCEHSCFRKGDEFEGLPQYESMAWTLVG